MAELLTGSKTKFADALRTALGKLGSVRCVEPKVTVESSDLDYLIIVEEVTAAVNAAMEGSGETKVFTSKLIRGARS